MLTRDYLTLRLLRLKSSEEWSFEAGRLLFLFPKGGSGRCVAGCGRHRLSPGDVLVVNAEQQGKVSVPAGGDLIFWYFSIHLENLFPLFAAHEIPLLQTVTEELKDAKLYNASQPAAIECHRLLLEVPPAADLGHRSQLLRIAAAILSFEFKQTHQQHTGFVRVDEHLLQVFETLSTTEILDLSVVDLAARFGCSRRHLSRLFHRYFGFSVANFRMEMRLLKAVSLLRDPDAKVINVAVACGFNHLGLFNNCFRRRFGASPTQWRKTNFENGSEPLDAPGVGMVCSLPSKGLCPWLGKPCYTNPNNTPAAAQAGFKHALINSGWCEPCPKESEAKLPWRKGNTVTT